MAAHITATVDAVASRVFVSVTGAASSISVERTDNSGGHVSIRGAQPAVTVGGGWTGFDYEAPLDTVIRYQVITSGVVTVVSAPVTLPSLGLVWLKHPGHPDRNMPITIEAPFQPFTYTAQQGIFNPINAHYPVVVTSQRSAAVGNLLVYTHTSTERRNLLSICADGAVLQLLTPDGYDVGSIYVAVGDVVENWVSDDGRDPAREFALPITIVNRPVGTALAGDGNAWSDVLANYATWADLIAAKASWALLEQQVAPGP